MPINPLILQRRHAELGRIRLGVKTPISNGKTRPEKLDRFRFTSPSRPLIDAIATLYGGTARPWDNDGKAEHEVITDATSIPVIVVKGGLSQWLEAWSGGGCIHRCDGERNVLTDAPCDLEEMVQVGRERINPHTAAKPTTRLSVMLRDVESLGVWRLESHGWNAAAEIPAMAELAMYVGDLVPATLHLVERRAVRDGKTSRFVVPVLDLAVSKQRLVELVGRQTGALDAGAAVPQIAAAPAPVDVDDITDDLADATTVEECQDVWRRAGREGRLTDEVKAAITARAQELTAREPAQVDPPAQVGDGGAAIWMQIVAEAGEAGWTTTQLVAAFEAHAGQPFDDGDEVTFAAFLAALRAGQVGAA